MTARTDLDRGLGAYFEARATSAAPDGLLATTLGRIETTRQRPGWLVPERWLPAPATIRLAGLTRGATRLALVALLVAIAVAAAVIIGSQRRLPPPFGPARPGLVVFDLSGDIYVANPDGSGRRQLTSGTHGDTRPTFSPDGTAFAYESRVGINVFDLIVMDAEGRHAVTVAHVLVDPLDLVWSPDSRRLAVSAAKVGDPRSRIYVVEADGSGARDIGGEALVGSSEPAWSPDGKQIAFKNSRPVEALWLMDADGMNAHRLTSTPGSGIAFWNTQWSPDGKKLAFLAGDDGSHQVYVLDADGNNEQNISKGIEDANTEEAAWPAWSPDGTKIAFPRMSKVIDVGTFVVVNPDGSDPLLLTEAFVNSNTAVWSPDGKRLCGYVWNTALQKNDGLAFFDVTNRTRPVVVSTANLGEATWQRLAP